MLINKEINKDIEKHSLIVAQLITGNYPWLDLIVRRWAILLEETLYYELRIMSIINAVPVKWNRFENVLDDEREQPIFIFETKNHGKALLILEAPFVKYLTQRKDDKNKEKNYSLKNMLRDHQKRILTMIRPLIRDFEKSWEKIDNYPLELKRITTHPKRAQIMLPYERCLEMILEIRIGEFKTKLILGLPFSEFHSFLINKESKKILPPESMDNYNARTEKTLTNILFNSSHLITAEIGKIDLKDSKGRIEKGKIIPLSSDGKMNISINKKITFRGELGISNNKYSVKINDLTEKEKQIEETNKRDFKTLDWEKS